MKIQPLFDRVVVKPVKLDTTKTQGIIVPESIQKPEISEVIALGIGNIENNPYTFTVKVGDKVLFNKYAGSDFVVNNETLTIIKEIDILGVIEN
ncbi:MAG: co-chaperone GroES [Clostridia bacterium]|nr:co-chaperone GroES [Clostridia bacterium]